MLVILALGAAVSVPPTIRPPGDVYVGAYSGPARGEATTPNMNGKYPGIANPAPGLTFPAQHRGEYIEVYGHPITNRYSEIFWTAQPAVALPSDFVKKYDGKAISITGFEVDIVRHGGTPKEESVPSYQWYNHHYCVALKGKAAEMVYVGRRTKTEGVTRRAIERNPPEYEPRAGHDANPGSPFPSAQMFWQGNGGEHRKSFKHYPKGYGQLLESPQEFHLQPMLINTHGQSGPDVGKHVSGPIPKGSYGGEPNQTIDRQYSPMMECPCTDRVSRTFTGYTTTVVDTCGNLSVTSPEQCFAAVQQLTGAAGHGGGAVVANITRPSPTAPSGCFMILHTGNGTESVEAHYNPTAAGVKCGATDGQPVRAIGQSDASGVSIEVELDTSSGNATITLAGPAANWFGVGFNAQQMNDLPYAITVEADGTVTERKLANHEPGSVLARQVEVLSSTVHAAGEVVKPGNHWGAPFRMVGPTANWQLCDALCAKNSSCVAWTYHPRQMDNDIRQLDKKYHSDEPSPYNLSPSQCYLRFGLCDDGKCGFTGVDAESGMMSGVPGRNQTRTVVLRRAMAGATAAHYSFSADVSSLNYIAAAGSTPQYAYHGPHRSGAALMMVEAGAPLCVCRSAHMGGSLNGLPWRDDCKPYPQSTVLRDHNPSCFLESYEGGMKCCMNGMQLLDPEQDIPPETDTVQMKWRFYYENVTALPNGTTSVTNAFFMFFETEAEHGEYDVPKCPAGTPPAECVHEIQARVALESSYRECHDRADPWCAPSAGAFPQTQFFKFVHMSPHCHGPACISMELIDADRNESICKTHPVYGRSDAVMDEAGYAAGILPCIWGSKEEGLAPPPVFPAGTNVLAIKRANSTLKHYGVMGHWQMRAAWATEQEYTEYRAYVEGRRRA